MAHRKRHYTDTGRIVAIAQARSKDTLGHADSSRAVGKGIVLVPDIKPQIVAHGSL